MLKRAAIASLLLLCGTSLLLGQETKSTSTWRLYGGAGEEGRGGLPAGMWRPTLPRAPSSSDGRERRGERATLQEQAVVTWPAFHSGHFQTIPSAPSVGRGLRRPQRMKAKETRPVGADEYATTLITVS